MYSTCLVSIFPLAAIWQLGMNGSGLVFGWLGVSACTNNHDEMDYGLDCVTNSDQY
jgi:hypothetical protein